MASPRSRPPDAASPTRKRRTTRRESQMLAIGARVHCHSGRLRPIPSRVVRETGPMNSPEAVGRRCDRAAHHITNDFVGMSVVQHDALMDMPCPTSLRISAFVASRRRQALADALRHW